MGVKRPLRTRGVFPTAPVKVSARVLVEKARLMVMGRQRENMPGFVGGWRERRRKKGEIVVCQKHDIVSLLT